MLVGAESDGPIETPSLAATGSPRGDEPHAPDGLLLPKPQPATPDASRCSSQTDRLRKYYVELAAMHRQITVLQSSVRELETECVPVLRSL